MSADFNTVLTIAGKKEDMLKMLECLRPYGCFRVWASVEGVSFFIAGELYEYESIETLEDYIYEEGGEVAEDISEKPDYLICSDKSSCTEICKKAQELGIEVITEQEFTKLFGETEQSDIYFDSINIEGKYYWNATFKEITEYINNLGKTEINIELSGPYGRFSCLEEVEQEVFEAMKKAAPNAVLSGEMAGWNSDGEDSECF